MLHQIPMFFSSWAYRNASRQVYEDLDDDDDEVAQELAEHDIDDVSLAELLRVAKSQLSALDGVRDAVPCESLKPVDSMAAILNQWERRQVLPQHHKLLFDDDDLLPDVVVEALPKVPFYEIDLALEYSENSDDDDGMSQDNINLENWRHQQLAATHKVALTDVLAQALRASHEAMACMEDDLLGHDQAEDEDDDDDATSFFISAPAHGPVPRSAIPTVIVCRSSSSFTWNEDTSDDDLLDPVTPLHLGTLEADTDLATAAHAFNRLLQPAIIDDAALADMIQQQPLVAQVKYDALLLPHEWLSAANHKSHYPLSYLVARNAALSVQACYEAFPEAIGLEDPLGLPLHYACMCDRTSLELLHFLLSCYPDGAKHTNARHETPLHVLCQQNSSSLLIGEKVAMLMDHYPTAAQLVDAQGYTPVHRLLQGNVTLTTLQLVCRASPNTVRAATRDWRKAIHIAAQHGASATVLDWLLQTDPAAAKATTEHFDSILHCAVQGGHANANMIARLIAAHPPVLHWTNGDDETPLDVARKMGANDEVLLLLSATSAPTQ